MKPISNLSRHELLKRLKTQYKYISYLNPNLLTQWIKSW